MAHAESQTPQLKLPCASMEFTHVDDTGFNLYESSAAGQSGNLHMALLPLLHTRQDVAQREGCAVYRIWNRWGS